MLKINRNSCLLFIGYWLLVIGLLIYSRFINISWGLPYPMQPDERNMAITIQSLNCNLKSQIPNLKSCFNPHFFAYGQFSLYLGYLIVWLMKFFDGDLGYPIGFSEAVIALRAISAIASIINFLIIIKIINLINKRKHSFHLLLMTYLLIIFSPFFIQFSHFGTTESLLMLFYSLIVYYSLLLINSQITSRKFIILCSIASGMAVATKISSLIFIALPIVSYISKIKDQRLKTKLKVQKFLIFNLGFVLCTLVFALVFSPHNLISWNGFFDTVRYETFVAAGKIFVFYTRQFVGSIPIIFQSIRIFPYVLGWPVLIFGLLGLLGLGWNDKKINLLRFAFFSYFIPTALLFAKWTRFMAPILPLMLIFSTLFFINIKVIKIIKIITILILILPGIAYLSIYQNSDVRFKASDWIYKNVPDNSYILSETANVVDIPLPARSKKVYKVINFDFYELDSNPVLANELEQHIKSADYVIVPSRRIFMNHQKKKYPLLNNYYSELFSGELRFRQVAEFNSYPKISLFGKTLIQFPDEKAEETWTVFDHPVIRIYQKIKKIE